jgi:hypothetical protein
MAAACPPAPCAAAGCGAETVLRCGTCARVPFCSGACAVAAFSAHAAACNAVVFAALYDGPLAPRPPPTRLPRAGLSLACSRGDGLEPASSLLSHCAAPLLAMLTTRDARALRAVCSEARDAVAAHPWADVETCVRWPAAWRACFPRACAALLKWGDPFPDMSMRESLCGVVVHMPTGRNGGGPETNLRRLRSCAALLTALHAVGVVHAAFSIENVPVFLDGAMPAGYASWLSKARNRRNSLAFMAPELFFSSALSGPAPPSPSSDVYAWGIAAWSALTCRIPHFVYEHEESFNLYDCDDDESFIQKIGSGARPPLADWMIPRIRPHRLDQLMLACWASDPRMRPSASHVVAEMDAIFISPGVDWYDVQPNF